MSSFRCLACVGLTFALCAASWGQETASKTAPISESAARQAGFEPADSSGLFIGIQQFEDQAFAEVPFAVDDAIDMAYLVSIELKLVPAERIVLALSGNAKKLESQQKLRQLKSSGCRVELAELTTIYKIISEQAQASKPKGLFVMSIAAHGFNFEGNDFIVAADSLERFISSTGISLSKVLDEVSRAGAPRRLVFLDACRERLARTRQAGPNKASRFGSAFQEAINRAKGQAILSAAVIGGYAYDDFDKKNGVFTGSILAGLRGAAPTDAKGLITVSTLADYVALAVREWIRQYKPSAFHDDTGILIRLEGPAAGLPLAQNTDYLQALRDRQRALGHLRDHIGGPISGAMYDNVNAILNDTSQDPDRIAALVGEIMAIDRTLRSKRSFAYYFENDWKNPPAKPADLRADLGRGVEIEFAQIEPGEFDMGSDSGDDDEKPVRRVQISKGFQLGKYEVTQQQWQAVMEDNPSEFKGARRPVENVSWEEVQEFVAKMNQRDDGFAYRLPTEAEWEYAARAGTTGEYAGKLDEMAWYGNNSGRQPINAADIWATDRSHYSERIRKNGGQTHEAGRKEANRWGLFDMHGNVWEWVQDWYQEGYYGTRPNPDIDPQGPASGSYRMVRGGGWLSPASNCRSANRDWGRPGSRSVDLGFRLLRQFR